jgi:hypothetical protein
MKKDIDKAVTIDNFEGSSNGRNIQWYTLKYNPECGLTILEADNSGDCYGDYGTYYFDSPKRFAQEKGYGFAARLLGDVDESDEAAMKFSEILFENGKKSVMNKDKYAGAIKVLTDNGIEPDEAPTVLQALCYVLIDEEIDKYMEEK